MAEQTVTLPDMGDFHDVPVAEILVAPGDVISVDTPLLMVESDKATMEVPSPTAGKVARILVDVGSKVSMGTPLVVMEANDAAPMAAEPQPAAPSEPEPKLATPPPPPQPITEQTVTVPDIGDFQDVPVAEILVAPGDLVAVDTPLLMVESEKATMEVPSPVAGRVAKVLVDVGSKVSMGVPIVVIEGAGAASSAEAPALAPELATPAPPSPEARPAITRAEAAAGGAVHATPSVRGFARELGVDLSEVPATGPLGRILREDVTGMVKSRLSSPASASGIGAGLPPWPTPDYARYGEVTRTPLTRIQSIAGANLSRNWLTIPHVTNFDEADITELEALRRDLNGRYDKEGVKFTLLTFMLKASALALRAFPRFNASLDGDDLVLKDYVHIGFAADTPSGLMVPVVRDVDRKGLMDIARDIAALSEQARAGTLKPADMQGGCFSVSSLGGVGGTGFTPIINAPEVAILGAGRSGTRSVWNGAEFAPRLVQPLSLSWDHRVVDGVAAARFLGRISAVLNDFHLALM